MVLLFSCGCLILHHLHRYLVQKDKIEDARKVLKKTRRADAPIEEELQDIINVVADQKKAMESVKGFILFEMFKNDHVRRALILGCLLQLFQQFSGINTGTS